MNDDNQLSVDDLDLTILTYLQVDGRKPFTEIAKCIGVAVGTVRNRVVRMIDDGVLHIFGRVIPHKVGFNAPATLLVSVSPKHFEDAVQELLKFPEVSYLAQITGEFDLMIDVMCRDVDHLTDLINNRLHKIVGVNVAHTSFILRVYRYAQPDLNLIQAVSRSHSDGVKSPMIR
jgi:Lrp/AsnC family transcriptional regulator, regulator for asnA, asnC and gidA